MLRPDRLVVAFTAVVVAALVLATVPAVPDLFDPDDGRALAAIAPTPAPPPLDLAPLKRFAPFGHTVAGPGGDPATFGLALRGILLAEPATASVALIAVGSGPAHGYAAGAALPGGATLDAIEFDLVVLRVGGSLVTLGLPGRAKSDDAPASTRGDEAPTQAVLDAVEPPPHIDELTLLGSLGATATPEGYRVGPLVDATARRAGLQPGDLVERVGGQPLGDPARDRRLYDAAAIAGHMEVEVVRHGTRLALTLPMN